MKNISLMGITVFSRLGGLFLLFVSLVRVLPLNDFGVFVVAYSYATILTLVVDFGFSQSLLKEIGSDCKRADYYIGDGLLLKVVLAISAALLALLIGEIRFDDELSKKVFGVLFLSCVINSFGEYYGTALRALGFYVEEAVVQFVYTVLMLGATVAVGFGTSSVVAVAVVLVVVRLVLLLGLQRALKRRVSYRIPSFEFSRIVSSARRGVAYAMDQGVSNFLMNIDVVLVSTVMGSSAAGIYQAGQKLVQGYSATAMIVSNVYIPKLARSASSPSDFRRGAIVVGKYMLMLGVIGAALLGGFPDVLVRLVYGPKFESLVALMPIFALLIFLRFIGATFGLCLTALGKQKLRFFANVACLFVVFASAVPLLMLLGLEGIVWSQVISISVLMAIYLIALNASLRGD